MRFGGDHRQILSIRGLLNTISNGPVPRGDVTDAPCKVFESQHPKESNVYDLRHDPFHVGLRHSANGVGKSVGIVNVSRTMPSGF